MARLPPPSAATVQKLQLSTAKQQIGSGGADFSSIAFCSSRTALSLLPTTVTETTPSSGGSKAGSTAAECDTPLSWALSPLAAIHGSDSSAVGRHGSSGGDKASRKLLFFVRLSVLGSLLRDGHGGGRSVAT
ncbi:uncharacterized protein DS421_15g505560 [Arachis hypogaea]|nr:uncharacterized protein DS421_15g505560 [Arachis hypogaea]